MKINYENIPRLLVPLFLVATIHFALVSTIEISNSFSVIVSLMIVVQLQKYELV